MMTIMNQGKVVRDMGVVIPQRRKDAVIEGELACRPVTTRNQSSSRWVEIEVYAMDAGGWLIHRVGMSVIYHRASTRCLTRTGKQSGEPIDTLDELPDDAEPCTICEPDYPEDLPLGKAAAGKVRFEFPRHSFDQCATRTAVVAKLTRVDKPGGRVGIISDPVAELLGNLEREDPNFRDSPKPVERYA